MEHCALVVLLAVQVVQVHQFALPVHQAINYLEPPVQPVLPVIAQLAHLWLLLVQVAYQVQFKLVLIVIFALMLLNQDQLDALAALPHQQEFYVQPAAVGTISIPLLGPVSPAQVNFRTLYSVTSTLPCSAATMHLQPYLLDITWSMVCASSM